MFRKGLCDVLAIGILSLAASRGARRGGRANSVNLAALVLLGSVIAAIAIWTAAAIKPAGALAESADTIENNPAEKFNDNANYFDAVSDRFALQAIDSFVTDNLTDYLTFRDYFDVLKWELWIQMQPR